MYSSKPTSLQPNSDPRNQIAQSPAPLYPQTQQSMNFSTGATSSTGSYQSWMANSSGAPMNDPFTPSRPHYQPGFLMSTNQNTTTPSGSQHFDEPPLIPTKFNPSASRTSPSEFGLESMFERSTSKRQRQPTSDEDAPPTASVNDIMDEAHINPFHHRDSVSGSPAASRRQHHASLQPQASKHPITYLNVFGYPLDRYETIAKIFQGLGDTTNPEPSENGHWFTVGFRQPWEAERALRRNGKIMDDTFMIGVARANGSSADTNMEGVRPTSVSGMPGSPPIAENGSLSKDVVPVLPGLTRSTSLGLPLTLAPSSAAFKPPSARTKPATPQTTPPQGVKTQEGSTLTKLSDMIFGW